MQKTLWLILLLLLPGIMQARDYPMLHYTQQDGLPSNVVYSIFQDTDGMIWFATDKGIARYNGLKFEHFTTNDGLPDNDVFFFRKDFEGRLWLSTYNGELCFYKNGVFHTARNTPFLREAGKNDLTVSLRVQPDSSIIIFFTDSYKFLVIKHNQVRTYKIPFPYIPAAIMEVSKHEEGFALSYGRYRLSLDTAGKLLGREEDPYVKPDLSSDFYCLRSNLKADGSIAGNITDRAGNIVWTVPDNFSPVSRINKFYRTADHFFVCTNYGLWMDNLLLLKDQKVSSVIQDQQGNYWVSTLNKGVYKLPRQFRSAYQYSNVYQSVVAHALKDHNSVLVGTEDMCLYRVTDTSVQRFFSFKEAFNRPVKAPEYAILSYAPNDYYLFTTYENFRVYQGKALSTQLMPGLKFIGGIKYFLQKNSRELYVHMTMRLQLTKPEALFTEALTPKIIPGTDTLIKKYVLRMSPDSSIWFTDINSVYRVSGGRAIRQPQFGTLTFREMAFCRNYLAGVDPFNRLILARDYNDSNIRIDSSADNNCVWDRFYPLTDSSLLVSTNDYYRVITFSNNGRYRIDILEYPFIPQLAERVYSDGQKCHFFKNGNITIIPVSNLISAPELPELHFTALRAGGKILVPDTFLQMSYAEARNLSLYYSVQSFNTQDISFEYSISNDGQPEQWIKSNGINIDLFHIASGTYTIKVRARTFGGRCSLAPAIRIEIGPPFWLSWWFFLLIISATGITVFLIVRSYTRRRIRQKERENKFLRSEFTALNALMNPHFVFNSLNSVQSLINKEELEAANQYVRTISDLLRQNMHNISRELIPLKKEMALIGNYLKLEQLRFKERLKYTINIAEDVEEDFLMVPPLLIQPLVENAIKYTLAFSEISMGNIGISIYNEAEKTVIDVTDNGKGLTKARQETGHESTALDNIRKRLEQLSQIHGKVYRLEIRELKDEQNRIVGTRASINIEQ